MYSLLVSDPLFLFLIIILLQEIYNLIPHLLYCRFSSDLYMIDDSLPFILNILLANFVGLLGIAVVLSYVQVLEKNKSSLWCYTFLEV